MKRTILIVDDIKSNREILKNILGDSYTVLESHNGELALQIMNEKYKEISAVLLDLGMPVLDGYEVLSYVREDERLSQIPILVTTGQTEPGSEERALKLGASDYVTKPYKSAIIKQRIQNTINLRETAATVNSMRRDRLTGLLSRDAFFELAAEMITAQEPNYYIMACFDIDKFKVINDQYGTEKGDKVLKHIAGVFREGFEANGGIVSRVSADNFAVLYPSSLKDSSLVSEMREKASFIAELAAPVVFSIGRYTVSDITMAPSAMYDRAMLAADTVKGKYDKKIACYDESMRNHLIKEQEIVTEMEWALKDKQFEVWLQPQYNHSSGALIGAEALVRWVHPKKGTISPIDFIPVFEQNGFVYALDKYVWEETCAFLSEQLKSGQTVLPVSVNVSRYDVFRPDFTETIISLTKKYNIPESLLRLEITESAFSDSTDHIVSVVRDLIQRGFVLEIDDFGSGYSSLNTLKSVPAQVVKLDMRFLDDTNASQRSGNILESIVRMTKWLGMSVIAEGVERKSQADFLKSIGCIYVQGYLYARPMKKADYVKLCASAKDKEEAMLSMETVENLDNNAFWNPESIDTLIFNSYVGAACVYEYHVGRIELLRASEKFLSVLGCGKMSIEQALKLNWLENLEKESRQAFIADLNKSIKSKEEISNEYVFINLPENTEPVYIRSTMRVIASAGERYLVYSTNENITAQKIAEQREKQTAEQLKAVMDNVACGITAYSMENKNILVANDKYYEILGYSKAEYEKEIGNEVFDIYMPQDRNEVISTIDKVRNTSKSASIEYRAIKRTGKVIWLRSHISMAYFGSASLPVQLSTYTDITEQKQTELDLKATSEMLSTMMNDIPGGFSRMRVHPGGSLSPVYVNEGFCQLTGIERDELMEHYRKDPMSGIHPQDLGIVKSALSKMLDKGEAYSSRYRLMKKDGKYIWISFFGRVTKDSVGNTYLNIYYTDLSEQIKQEERQKELLDNLPYGVALYEFDDNKLSVIHLNKRYWELVNRNEQSYFGADFLNAVHKEDHRIIEDELRSAIKENRDAACDIRVLYGKNEYRPFHVVGRIKSQENGRYSIYAAYTPISPEEMSIYEIIPIALSTMMDSQAEYSYIKDKNLKYVCMSREAAKMIGLKDASEARGKTDSELFNKETADAFAFQDHNVLQSKQALLDYVQRIPYSDGSIRFMTISKFPLRDAAGNVVGIYGTGRDITENRELRSRFELLTNSIPGGIASYEYSEGSFHLSFLNEGFLKLFEIDRDEYEQKSRNDIYFGIFDEDKPKIKNEIERCVKEKEQIDCIFRARTKSGGYKWINLKAAAPEIEQNTVMVNVVLFDVTAREESIENLRISEEENRLAMQHTQNAVGRYDIATRTLHIPFSTQKRHNLPETLENVPDSQIECGAISSETKQNYIKFYEDIMSGIPTGSATFQRILSGSKRWIEAHYSTIFSGDQKPISAVVSFTDITEQLEKDFAYKRWQQSIADKPPESYSLFRCSVNSRTSFYATEGSLIESNFISGEFGFDERTVEYARKYVAEDDKERFIAFLKVDNLLTNYYQGKRIISLEYREQLANNKTRWINLTVDLVEHTHSTEVEAYLLFEDIDQAKRMELATIEKANTDPLTGVMNRLTFASKVNNIIQTSAPGTKHALMMLDIDGFKLVNDYFGHGAGDQTLIDVAATLSTALRHNDLVGRLGGDEFFIFLNDIPNEVIAANKAKQICSLTRKAFSAEVGISGSIGIAVVPKDGIDFETLYKKVDAALYHVKGSGKDNYAFYYDDIAHEHLDTKEKEEDTIEKNKKAVSTKKRRMLIVDDSSIDHALLTNIFADDFIIEKANDGNSALIRLRHYGSAISVVLLDLVMPGMDGFEVLKRMQENSEIRNIPVIVVSASENQQAGLMAIRQGAVDYVTKPVDPEILRIRVSSAIAKADNERLHAKNSLLEYQSGELSRYKTALAASGIVVIENDWIEGKFIYDPNIQNYLLGKYDDRNLWYILLSDMVAQTDTVKLMQEHVQKIAIDRKNNHEFLFVRLKTPKNIFHWFRLTIYKSINEYGAAGKIYMTLSDIGEERPDKLV